jgi:tight adherence protein B
MGQTLWAIRASSRASAQPTASQLSGLLIAVSAQIRAGADPMTAWTSASDVLAISVPLAHPDQPAVQAIAAAWRLADRTGAPLAQTLGAIADRLRRSAEDQAELAAEIAGPQATMRLLIALPGCGVFLGQLMGAQPVQIMTTTAIGRGCAGAGLLLLAGGGLWMRAAIQRVAALT